jgi:hypothetical protein
LAPAKPTVIFGSATSLFGRLHKGQRAGGKVPANIFRAL